MSNIIGVYRVSNGAKLPEKGTKWSACDDVSACLDHVHTVKLLTPENMEKDAPVFTKGGELVVNIPAWHRALVPTGLILDIPEGYSYRGHPRSGGSFKRGVGLVNSEGVIDADYVNEMMAPIINLTGIPLQIQHRERIVQFELVKDEERDYLEYDEPPEQKTDREGGYGSTGS